MELHGTLNHCLEKSHTRDPPELHLPVMQARKALLQQWVPRLGLFVAAGSSCVFQSLLAKHTASTQHAFPLKLGWGQQLVSASPRRTDVWATWSKDIFPGECWNHSYKLFKINQETGMRRNKNKPRLQHISIRHGVSCSLTPSSQLFGPYCPRVIQTQSQDYSSLNCSSCYLTTLSMVKC